jgi:hypothetical protein
MSGTRKVVSTAGTRELNLVVLREGQWADGLAQKRAGKLDKLTVAK